MSDVEKYGLVAVVFVGGLLLVIATQGGFGGGDAKGLAPEVIDSATPLRAAAPKAGAGNTVRVVSVLPDTPFKWDEPPVPYPGRRSTSASDSANGETADKPHATAPSGPSSSEPVAAAESRVLPGTHAVAKGETLETIADEYLGSKTRWRELLPLNPGLDPKKLQIGQVVRVSSGQGQAPLAALPTPQTPAPAPMVAAPLAKKSPAASTTASSGKGRTHTVAKGDTLGAIAKKYLGSTARADEIFTANTDVLKSKDDLAVGQVLRIP